MKNTKRRLTSWILTLAMLLTLVPVMGGSANAAEYSTSAGSVSVDAYGNVTVVFTVTEVPSQQKLYGFGLCLFTYDALQSANGGSFPNVGTKLKNSGSTNFGHCSHVYTQMFADGYYVNNFKGNQEYTLTFPAESMEKTVSTGDVNSFLKDKTDGMSLADALAENQNWYVVVGPITTWNGSPSTNCDIYLGPSSDVLARPSFTVTYDANGGSGTMDPQTYVAGTNIDIPENRFTPPEGKVFAGFKSESGGTIYANVNDNIDGATTNFRIFGDLTLYAQWREPGGETNPEFASAEFVFSYADTIGKIVVGEALPDLSALTTDSIVVKDTEGNPLPVTGIAFKWLYKDPNSDEGWMWAEDLSDVAVAGVEYGIRVEVGNDGTYEFAWDNYDSAVTCSDSKLIVDTASLVSGYPSYFGAIIAAAAVEPGGETNPKFASAEFVFSYADTIGKIVVGEALPDLSALTTDSIVVKDTEGNPLPVTGIAFKWLYKDPNSDEGWMWAEDLSDVAVAGVEYGIRVEVGNDGTYEFAWDNYDSAVTCSDSKLVVDTASLVSGYPSYFGAIIAAAAVEPGGETNPKFASAEFVFSYADTIGKIVVGEALPDLSALTTDSIVVKDTEGNPLPVTGIAFKWLYKDPNSDEGWMWAEDLSDVAVAGVEYGIRVEVGNDGTYEFAWDNYDSAVTCSDSKLVVDTASLISGYPSYFGAIIAAAAVEPGGEQPGEDLGTIVDLGEGIITVEGNNLTVNKPAGDDEYLYYFNVMPVETIVSAFGMTAEEYAEAEMNGIGKNIVDVTSYDFYDAEDAEIVKNLASEGQILTLIGASTEGDMTEELIGFVEEDSVIVVYKLLNTNKVAYNYKDGDNLMAPGFHVNYGVAYGVYGVYAAVVEVEGSDVPPEEHEHEYKYTPNNDGTHNYTCECGEGEDAIENEPCTYVDGKCEKCGYEEPAKEELGQIVDLGEGIITVEGNNLTVNKPAGDDEYLYYFNVMPVETIVSAFGMTAEEYAEAEMNGIGKNIVDVTSYDFYDAEDAEIVKNLASEGQILTLIGASTEGDMTEELIGFVEEDSVIVVYKLLNTNKVAYNYKDGDNLMAPGFHVKHGVAYGVYGVYAAVVEVEGSDVPPEHEHEYKYTPNNDGTHNYTCECGEGEDAIENESCTYVDGKCEKCGYEEPVTPPEHEHEYKYTPNNDGTHNGACECGEDAIENEPCTYVDGKCEKCGYEEPVTPPEHEHEYKYTPNNDGTHNGACECGEDAIENEPCTYVDGKCEKCGYEEPVTPPEHEHEYKYTSNNDGTHNYTCECGEGEDAIENEPCTYVDGKCEKCGYEEPGDEPIKYSVTVTVKEKISEDEFVFCDDATVTLVSLNSNEQTQNICVGNGVYVFENVVSGTYNLVVEKGEKTKTVLVTIKDADADLEVVLPIMTVNSQVDVSVEVEEDSPIQGAAVGGLDELADNIAEDVEHEPGTEVSVDVTMNIEAKMSDSVVPEHKEKIEEIAQEQSENLTFLDIKIDKTITTKKTGMPDDVQTDPINDTEILLEIVIPFDTNGRSEFAVYRYHELDNSIVQKLTETPNNDGEYITVDFVECVITMYVRYFSTYAIGYSEGETPVPPVTPDVPNLPYIPSYRVDVESVEGGTIIVSPKTAIAGSPVTVTVTPDEGFELVELIITTATGKEVKWTCISDGKYTFVMPYGEISVSAVFAKIKETCPKNSTCPIWPFKDAETTEWYHDGVHYCIENGLMNGLPGKLFDPNGTTTRAQIVTILWRLEGEPVVNYAMGFADVAAGQWYTEAVRWAAAEGIVLGYSDTVFAPDDVITREQMAAILWRYCQYKEIDVSVGEDTNILSYSDAFDVHSWAMAAMQWACGAGVINGIADGNSMKLDPTGSATRAQVATMLWRFCEEIVEP